MLYAYALRALMRLRADAVSRRAMFDLRFTY